MSTPNPDNKYMHLEISCVLAKDLPEIDKKQGVLRKTQRDLYAAFSVDDRHGRLYEVPFFDGQPIQQPIPMKFYSKSSSTLEISLYAVRSRHDDIFLARGYQDLTSIVSKERFEVFLTPSAGSELATTPVLTFTASVSKEIDAHADFDSLRSELALDSRLTKAMMYFGFVVKVAEGVAELNPIAKIAVGMIGIMNSAFGDFIKRNDEVLELLEVVERACTVVVDVQTAGYEGDRARQLSTIKILVDAIDQCMYLLGSLSIRPLGQYLSLYSRIRAQNLIQVNDLRNILSMMSLAVAKHLIALSSARRPIKSSIRRTLSLC
ncbi:hypothetical protein HGRIS_011790 [Hohenbuehelia grisea]|uniref:Uncharacterized protein n=1 Tax=Hohenbuehelia grisea TaxID=104357 RepID=A0ABR3JW71_9AGAR